MTPYYPVDLHTHTVACNHAYSTVQEYIAQAPKCGIRMFANTDHGPALPDGAHLWHFANLRVLPRLVDDVAILRGVEANISKEGGIDIPDYILGRLDIVLAGFHSTFEPTTKEEHTKILCTLIKSGKADIITHPGWNRFPVDYEEVLTCAKEYNVALEINSSTDVNSRIGSYHCCVELVRLAAKIGTPMAVGSDAHISYYLGNFGQSFKIMYEAGFNEEDVINTSPLRVLDFLESRGHAPIKELRGFFGG